VITSCVYTVQYRTTQIRRTVNVDNLAPYVVRSHQRFPERPGVEDDDPDEETVEVDEEDEEKTVDHRTGKGNRKRQVLEHQTR
jgi:hypothetical protein